ncbi:23S rRNA (uracil(1939)-C(5))-methyltransferase RlmD [Acinetobacter stercoris]|uniref:23S rRNA (uracil(1939)-C(5))-methyltransferase RlmD n=1 Tax=Acinetobacter stercoris TaxID=2126983 RepID=A0A2U3N3D3_9GAMM|nr:23S rRNA (uracil(1939)-C(5))-methyltransferase RlmD [Acinetobacter stercoris]SPL72188.1 23S rRNA (uracil(1939)-C(5))-methyltransferase RlmD [Acinetobacter stercoris]
MKHRAKPHSSQPQTFQFKVESLSHEGRGIAHYSQEFAHPVEKQGKKVFIRYALPGEIVLASITKDTKKLEEADCIELESDANPYRIEPICPHFGICGGCNVQHIHPDEQIRFKQDVLKSHLSHFAGLQPEQWLKPLRSTRTDYRHKARLGVRYLPQKQKLLMGFREVSSNRLVEIKTCKVLEFTLDQSLPELKRILESLKGKAAIGHVELAKGDQDIALVVRHTENLPVSDIEILKQFTLQLGWQLYLQPNAPKHIHRIDHINEPERLHYSLPDFNLEFAFHPQDFTQVNPTVNPQMVKLACDLLDLKHGERVLDLFCGLGNFSLPLARQVGENGKVVAVEGSEAMVERGTENALKNGIQNVTFYSQDLTKDFSQHYWANQGFDALLIDPPRAGAEEIMHYVPNFGAKRIVYVSCNPATLARDAGILTKYGYQLKKAGVMDMFTHTGHVESIALFEKNLEIND